VSNTRRPARCPRRGAGDWVIARPEVCRIRKSAPPARRPLSPRVACLRRTKRHLTPPRDGWEPPRGGRPACDRNLFWRSDGGQPFGELAGGADHSAPAGSSGQVNVLSPPRTGPRIRRYAAGSSQIPTGPRAGHRGLKTHSRARQDRLGDRSAAHPVAATQIVKLTASLPTVGGICDADAARDASSRHNGGLRLQT